MKVSLSWLKELVDFDLPPTELADKLSLTSIGVKEQTEDYMELDLTYNRADLLSLRGVAREVAAITGCPLLFQSNEDYIWNSKNLPQTPVEIEDEILSPLQDVAKIEGLKFDKSPEEWVKKLNECGMRTVNNIADVTNLIMLEYGQPLHSFDAETVKNDLINVRLAKEGEEIRTLDNKLRKLTNQDIVLSDTDKPLDVAGLMGGKDTEIKESTTTILLSASMFNPSMVRKTAKRLGLYSEASKRFQHGLTKTNLLQAFAAAIKMYEGIGGKLTGLSIKGDLADKAIKIELNREKINSLIGIDIPVETVESSLKALGFKLASHISRGLIAQGSGNIVWDVTIPYWRKDISIEEDLIEEIARMYGYEKTPSQELTDNIAQKLDQSLQELVYLTKQTQAEAGLTETQTYSFYSGKVIENCKLKTEKLLRIANPISSETEYLRDNLWPNLLETTTKNIKEGIKDVAIFELGKVYRPKKGDLPEEPYHLAIALSNGADNPIEELLVIARNIVTKQSSSGTNSIKIATPAIGRVRNDSSATKTLFHPTRFATLEKDGKEVGFLAEIHPRIVNKFGIEQRVAVLEIEL